MLRLKAEFFRSFQKLEYTIQGNGLVVVEGFYEGTQNRSNGAGKSTFLPDLLSWAIYGKTVDGKRQVCQKTPVAAKETTVELETDFVKLKRTQQADGTRNTLEIAGVKHRGLEEGQAYLAKFFPSHEIFCSTVIIGQGVGERLSAWAPAARAKVLAELVNLQLWYTARKKLSKDAQALQASAYSLEGGIKTLELQVASLKGAPQADPSHRAAIEKSIEDLRCESIKQQTDLVLAEKEYREQYQAYVQAKNFLSSLIGQRDMAKAELEATVRNAQCPTCKRPYPKEQVDQAVAAATQRLQGLTGQINEAGFKLGSLRDPANLDTVLAAHRGAVAKINANLQELGCQLARMASHAEQIVSLEASLKAEVEKRMACQQQLDQLKVLDEAFQQIPIRKIDNILNVLNVKLVDICNGVWESEFLVQLTSEKSLKKGGTEDEIGLTVQNQAGSYDGSSPGQRRKIDLSIQLALRDLLMSSWPHALPLLICDDVVDVLDGYARQRLYSNFLVPAAQHSTVFVLTPQCEHPVPINRRVVIGYREDCGSWVAAYQDSTGRPVITNG